MRLELLICCLFIKKSFPLSLDHSTLRNVQIIFRHGDRTPATVNYFPTDPPEIRKSWPAEMGESTPLGMRQMYKLGETFVKNYGDFIGNTYEPSKLYVMCGNNNRTAVSALCVLAAMFTPNSRNNWNPEILWQPIPIHSRQMIDEITLDLLVHCPPTLPKILQSDYYKTLKEKNKDLMKFIQENSGMKIKNLIDLEHALDNLVTRAIHQDTNPLPEWARNESLYNQFESIRAEIHTAVTAVPAVFDVSGAWFMNEIVSRMRQAANEQIQHQMVLYSGHDTSIRSVTTILNSTIILPQTHIEFGAWLAIELHQVNGLHYVQLLYSDNFESEPESIEIPNCSWPCTFDMFSTLTHQTTSLEWRVKCGLPVQMQYIHERAFITLLLIIAILLFLLLITSCIGCCRARKTMKRAKIYPSQYSYTSICKNQKIKLWMACRIIMQAADSSDRIENDKE